MITRGPVELPHRTRFGGRRGAGAPRHGNGRRGRRTDALATRPPRSRFGRGRPACLARPAATAGRLATSTVRRGGGRGRPEAPRRISASRGAGWTTPGTVN